MTPLELDPQPQASTHKHGGLHKLLSERISGGIHHVGLQVPNLEKAVQNVVSNGGVLYDIHSCQCIF